MYWPNAAHRAEQHRDARTGGGGTEIRRRQRQLAPSGAANRGSGEPGDASGTAVARFAKAKSVSYRGRYSSEAGGAAAGFEGPGLGEQLF